MKKLYTIFSIFFLFCGICVFADTLDDYETALAKAADNYKAAVTAPDSEYAKEYEKLLQQLEISGSRLQKIIFEAKLGRDYNFSTLSIMIRKHYREEAQKFIKNLKKSDSRKKSKNSHSNNSKKYKTKFKLDNHTALLFQILSDDIAGLRKMKYSDEEGSVAVDPMLTDKFAILELKRLLGFFSKYRGKYLNSSNKVFRSEFERRSGMIGACASAISASVEQQGNDVELPYNITTESQNLAKAFALQKEYHKTGGKNKPKIGNEPQRNIDLAISRIRQVLTALEKSSMGKDSPSKKQGKTGRVGNSVSVKYIPEVRSYENVPVKDLVKDLLARRTKIYRGNTMISGIDKETLRKYRLSLTKAELKIFEQTRKEDIKNGYESSAADKDAVFRIQSEANPGKDARELAGILERMDDDEARIISQETGDPLPKRRKRK